MIPPEATAAPGAPATESPSGQPGAQERPTVPQSMGKWLRDSGITSPPQDADPDSGEDTPAAPVKPKKPKVEPTLKPDDKPKAGDKPVDEPPMRVRGKTVTRPALPVEERRPDPARPKADEDKPDPKWEEGLEQSEKDILAEAREVERLIPDKHKGLSARAAKFVRDHQKYVEEQGDDFDENAQEYKDWLTKNQPQLSRDDIREVESVRVEQRVRQKVDPEVGALRHELFVRDKEPEVTQDGQRMYAELESLAVPKEVLDAIRKEGPSVFGVGGRYRLEVETAQAVLTTAVEDLKELTRLGTTNPSTGKTMAEEATDASQPKFEQHERLRGLVKGVCEDFLRNGTQAEQFKDGKWFVTREEYNQIPAAKRGQWWTFSNKQIIERAKGAVKATLTEAIRIRQEYMEQRGYKRQNGAPAPAAPNVEPKDTPRIPGSSPVAAPGPSDEPADGNHLGRKLVGMLNRQPDV